MSDTPNNGRPTSFYKDRNLADGILKTVGGGLLTLCCIAIAWSASSIINLKLDVVEVRTNHNALKEETTKRTSDIEKRFDKLELQLADQFRSVNAKLDRLSNRPNN